ncbi:hypothetical protein KJ708_09585, partial [bacterium]|nr:hypothetical protein [bacterium]
KDFPTWMSQDKALKEANKHNKTINKNYSLKEYLSMAKRDYILKCVEDFGGNIFKTAQALRIARSTIYRALKGQET